MFKLDKATPENLAEIVAIMKAALPLIPNPEWFLVDPPEYLARHFGEEGFTLKAVTENHIAGFLTVRIPKDGEDNLGYTLNLPPDQLLRSAHMETCVVHPDYRGHHLEARLFEEAESILKDMGFLHLFGTVHPDNLASLKSFQRCGFSVVVQEEKYGGYLRNVMYKRILPCLIP